MGHGGRAAQVRDAARQRGEVRMLIAALCNHAAPDNQKGVG